MEILLGLVILVAVVGSVAGVAVKRGGRRLYAWQWRDGERWVRFYPNPGLKVSKRLQWSKHYGWGER